jgi:hypothetical protein
MAMNSTVLFFKYAKYCYIAYRISLRFIMGKKKRDEYLQRKEISMLDFLPERAYSILSLDGIKGIPRRYTNFVVGSMMFFSI